MNNDVHENLCPKCGQISANFDVCDNCGALLDRLRDTDVVFGNTFSPSEGLDPRAGYAPAPAYDEEPAPRPWLTIIAVCVLIVGAIAGGFMISKQRAREKESVKQTETGAQETHKEPEPVAQAPLEPSPSPAATPVLQAPAPAAQPVDAGAVQQDKANGMIGWLNSLKTPAATATPSITAEQPAAAATPESSDPPAQIAAAPARQSPTATKKSGEINLDEDVFTRKGASSEQVAKVMEKLDAERSTPAPTQDQRAAPQRVNIPVVTISESNFQSEVMTYSASPVLIAFFSPKVPESSAIATTVLQLAQQPVPRIKVGIVNAEESKGLRQRYTITTLPTSVLVKNGQEITRFVGDLQIPLVNQAVQYSSVKNLPHLQ